MMIIEEMNNGYRIVETDESFNQNILDSNNDERIC